MKFSIKDFFSKCDQIRRKLRIWSQLLQKSLMENFIFCAVIRLKFEDTLLTSLTKLVLESKASICSKTKKDLRLYYRGFSVFIIVVII